MTSNDETLKDEDGATPDWLELYNNSKAKLWAKLWSSMETYTYTCEYH